MISGEIMKKLVTIKQTQFDTNDKNILFKGYLDVDKSMTKTVLSYVEGDGVTKVNMIFEDDKMHLERHGEMTTIMHFDPQVITEGSVISPYGTIPINIDTHKYINKDHTIAVEYDVVMEGEVSGRFRLICQIKEVLA